MQGHGLGRAIGLHEQVIVDAVVVQKALFGHHSILSLKPNLDNVQGSHEQRHQHGSRAGGGHLLKGRDPVDVQDLPALLLHRLSHG